MYKSSQFTFVIAVGLFLGVCGTFIYIGSRRSSDSPTFKLDQNTVSESIATDNKPEKIPEPLVKKAPPSSALIEVPFYAQAPFGRWDAIHKETCEEASLLMVYTYKKKMAAFSTEDLDKKLISFVEWQTLSGYEYDLTVRELRDAASAYLSMSSAEIINNPTIEVLEREVSDGNPVIVPAAGRLLPNPYFTPPGPRYHMLVVIGYDDDEFITNDPGTRRGEKFRYQKKELMNAIHDYTAGDITTGSRNVLVYR